MQSDVPTLVRKPSDFGYYADSTKKNKGINGFSGKKWGVFW
jgi:hypothetical protein